MPQNRDTPSESGLPRRSNRGFASMDPEKQRAIASKGGQASGGNFANDPQRAAVAGRKGGQMSGGNFANNPQRAAEAGRKGGQQSGGNFANNPMRAAEAGRKGGQASGSQRQHSSPSMTQNMGQQGNFDQEQSGQQGSHSTD